MPTQTDRAGLCIDGGPGFIGWGTQVRNRLVIARKHDEAIHPSNAESQMTSQGPLLHVRLRVGLFVGHAT